LSDQETDGKAPQPAHEEGAQAGYPFAAALAAWEAQRGLPQGELARRASMKRETLRGYKRGDREPAPPQLARLGAALGTRPERLRATADLFNTIDRLPAEASLAPAEAALVIWADFGALLGAAARQAVAEASGDEHADASPEAARARAEALVGRLRNLSTAVRGVVVEGSALFRGAAVVSRLGEEGIGVTGASAEEASTWAGFAALAARLTPGPEPTRRLLVAQALAYQANAARVGGEVERAEALFAEALDLRARSAAVPGVSDSRFWDLLSSLRRAQRRFGEALDLLDQALAGAAGVGRARLGAKRAKVLEELGRTEEAILELRHALPLIDPEAEPRLAWVVRFNLLVTLCDLGRTQEASPLLPEVRVLAERLGNVLDLLRHDWIEGRIAAIEGRRAEAIERLDRVRQAFLDRKISYDAALVTLELAVVYLEDGRTSEVKEVTSPLVPLFAALKIDREALAALRLFCAGAESEAVTLLEARRLRELLRRGGEGR
jgi:tetratricopeptide (TPR) repeat protein